MTLRTKTLVILATGSVVMVLIAFFLSRYQVLKGFDKQDREDTRINIGRVEHVIDNEIEDISSTTNDYSYWDETVAFMQGKDPEYITRNVTPATFENLRLDLMAFVDETGKLVYIKAYDFTRQKDIPIPQGFIEELAVGKPLVTHHNIHSSIAGILSLPSGAMFIGSRPILSSLKDGPIRGSIIFARFLDEDEAFWLSERILVPMAVYNLSGSGYPESINAIAPQLKNGEMVIIPANKNTLSGYASINDIYGRPSIAIKIDQRRVALAQGQRTLDKLELLRIGAALAVIVIVLTLLDRLVFRRVYLLKKNVDDIGNSTDLSKRVATNPTSRDEISALEHGINQMLMAIETSRKENGEDERRYKAVVDQATECVLLIDPETKGILEANSSAERISGFTRKDLLAKTFYDLHPSMKDEINHYMNFVIEHIGEEAVNIGEREGLTKDGSVTYLEVNMSAVPYKDKYAIAVVEHDISEKRKASIEIERLRHQNELILEFAGQGIIGLDKEGLITFANPSSSILTGYEMSDLLGKPLHETLHHSKNNGGNYPRNECPTSNTLANGKVNYTMGEVFWRKDGTSFPVEYVSTPMNENGEIIGAVIVFNEEVRTRFLSILSHELRTPLTPIKASSGMLLEVLGNDKKSVQARLVRNISAGVETLRSRIDDLMDTASFQAGSFELKVTSCDPKISIQDMCEMMRPVAEEKKIKIHVNISEEPVSIIADPERFQQVLVNLLQNAVKFSPASSDIVVNSYSDGDFLIVSVHDEGPGISKENQKRLFNPYFQASRYTPSGGLGLGLFLTKQIVEKHRGEVWMESSEGAGSTFSFSLPIEGPDSRVKE